MAIYTNVQHGAVKVQFQDTVYDVGVFTFSQLFDPSGIDVVSFDELLASFITRDEREFIYEEMTARIGMITQPQNIDLSQFRNAYLYGDTYLYVIKDDINPNRMIIIWINDYPGDEIGNKNYQIKIA